MSIFYGVLASRINYLFARKKVLIATLCLFSIVVFFGNFVNKYYELYISMGAAGIAYIAGYTYLLQLWQPQKP